MNEPQDLLSFSAYGRRRGWSQAYVSKLVASGRIPVTADRKIDPAVADRAIEETVCLERWPQVQANAARRAQKAAATPVVPQKVPTPFELFGRRMLAALDELQAALGRKV